MIHLVNNKEWMKSCTESFNYIYADMMYEDSNLDWLDIAVNLLKFEGVIAVQTDYHTLADVITYFKQRNFYFINDCIYLNEWGGVPKKAFGRKHDNILIYSWSNEYKWFPDNVRIEKKTAGTAFDKKGTGMKVPCDVFYDHISFSTMSGERVKDSTGKGFPWQKPLWLYERIISPFTETGDSVLDPFMGTGSCGVWCEANGRAYTGLENNPETFELAKLNLGVA